MGSGKAGAEPLQTEQSQVAYSPWQATWSRMGVYTAVAFTGVVTLPALRWPRVMCKTPASPSTAHYQCLESTSSGLRLSFLRLS